MRLAFLWMPYINELVLVEGSLQTFVEDVHSSWRLPCGFFRQRLQLGFLGLPWLCAALLAAETRNVTSILL